MLIESDAVTRKFQRERFDCILKLINSNVTNTRIDVCEDATFIANSKLFLNQSVIVGNITRLWIILQNRIFMVSI